jgi:hypothetical protein
MNFSLAYYFYRLLCRSNAGIEVFFIRIFTGIYGYLRIFLGT